MRFEVWKDHQAEVGGVQDSENVLLVSDVDDSVYAEDTRLSGQERWVFGRV